jgi:S1-C subfamily serine protease
MAGVPELGQRFPFAAEATVTQAAKVTHPDAANPARYLRARLEVLGSSGTFFLTVRDRELRVVEVLTEASFLRGARWTARVPGPEITLELQAGDHRPESKAVKVAVREYIAMPAKAKHAYYSVQDPAAPRFRSLYPRPDETPSPVADGVWKPRGDSVALVMPSQGQTSWCCSGVVVGPDLLLTNWHCGGPPATAGATSFPTSQFWSDAICRDTVVDLSWDNDKESRELQCVSVAARNRERDFAILRTRPLGAGPGRPARLRGAPVATGNALVVLHHPECLPKQITDGCSVIDGARASWVGAQANVDFTHKCDTQGGSSGGPIFDGQGRVVGLHHLGFDEAEDTQLKTNKLNGAIRMDAILSFLATCVAPDCEPGLVGALNVEP